MSKGPTYIGGAVGSTLGSFVPGIWGAGQFSMWSMAFFFVGGFVGIWLAFKVFA